MRKKHIIIAIVAIVILLGGTYIFVKTRPINPTSTNEKVEINESTYESDIREELKFLREIAGVKATEIELINNPIGLKGEFIAPRESILKGIDYFLKDTKNSTMKDISIDIGDGYVNLKTTYKVNSFISTPIEVKVKPSLDNNKNLVLEVYQFKFLDLNVPKWIIDIGVEGFVKDWFPNDKDFKVTFEKGKVVVDKSNYEGVILNKLSIDTKGLKIDMIINLEKLL